MESMRIPKNSIVVDGVRLDFSRLIIRPRCCRRKIVVSLAIKISFSDLPIRMKSSRYITILMFSLLIDTGIFIIFVKILGAGEIPKQRHKNWCSFLSIETVPVLVTPCVGEYCKRHLSGRS